MLKILFIVILNIPINLCLAQDVSILDLKNKPFFVERNQIVLHKNFKLNQIVFNRNPEKIKEQYSYNLEIIFLDTFNAKRKKILLLNIDSSIVKYSFSKVVFDTKLDGKCFGTVTILKWTEHFIEISYQIESKVPNSKTVYSYKGKRKFKSLSKVY